MATIKRDYYEVLSVEKTADGDTIKKSFRKLAMEYHPDRNHGNEEAAEVKNNADSLVHATEKQLEEHGDKIDASLKSEVEEKIAAVKTALEGGDAEAINSAAQDLTQSAMKMGQSIYEKEQASAAEAGAEEEVVDAEFSEVDEDAKN